MNPIKLIEDLFEDKNLSDANLRAFCEDMLQRLSIPINNPGGIYLPLITTTSARYAAFFGQMTNAATKKAVSEGLTQTMEANKKAMIDFISDLQNLVKFIFRETSATYQEFYPQGMTEYHHATLAQLPMLIQRYLNAANDHLIATNPAEVADLVISINAFNTRTVESYTLTLMRYPHLQQTNRCGGYNIA